MSPSDHDLLRDYRSAGSQTAFATLVDRHLTLVYSAARRQVRSPQLAEDIAQSVFIDLARRAATMNPATPLVAWLHLVTRRTAIDVVRRESRRQAREHAAAALETIPSDAATWTAVEPLLDEAVESLDAPDRTAILLRFFESKTLREVGAALGISDDAAQKRITRALDQLRAFFLRRGVALTAAGLVEELGAHVIVTAPASLAAAISAPSFLFAATSSVTVVAMTTLQKSALLLTLALLAGFGVYETTLVRRQRDELARLGAQLAAAHASHSPAVVAPRASPAPAALSSVDPAHATGALDQRVALLKQLLDELPAQRLPELRLLEPADWLAIARTHELDSAADIRVALADLRAVARKKIASSLQEALRRYLATSDGHLPTDIAQLAPFLTAPADPEMLARYELTRPGRIGEPSERLLREKATSDLILSVGLDGWGLTNNSDLPAAFGESNADAIDRAARALGTALGDDANEKSNVAASIRTLAASIGDAMKSLEPVFGEADAFGNTMKQAADQFQAAHPGETITNMAQVLPFLKDSEKFAAAFRPFFAQLAYVREHDGQPPTSPAQLQPYLARPFSAVDAFRDMKLRRENDRLTLDFDLPDKP